MCPPKLDERLILRGCFLDRDAASVVVIVEYSSFPGGVVLSRQVLAQKLVTKVSCFGVIR